MLSVSPDRFRDLEPSSPAEGVLLGDGRLALARDRAGLGTIYYARSGGMILVSDSLLEISTALGGLTPDPASVCEHLVYRYVSGTRTLFREISKVPAGYTVVLVPEAEGWREDMRRSDGFDWQGQEIISFDDTASRLACSLSEALSSSGGSGLFFSGGLDSCVLAALMPERPECYNVSPSDPEIDESSYATTAAEHMGLSLTVRKFDREGFLRAVRRAVELSEGTIPVEQMAMYAHLMDGGATRARMATGYGADFLMGESQRKYWMVMRASRLLGLSLLRLGVSLYGGTGMVRRQQAHAVNGFIRRFGNGQTWVEMMPDLDPPCDPEPVRRAMGLDEMPDIHGHRRRLLADEMPPHFTQRIFVTYSNLIADTVSSWARLCRASGSSLSVPFLDRRVVDLVTGLAPSSYMSMREAKPPVRRIASGTLSRELLDRPKKHGLMPPGFILTDTSGAVGSVMERLSRRSLVDAGELARMASGRERYGYLPFWSAFTMETLFEVLEDRGVAVG